jgi:ABC-type transport system involved in cytochrome c biogenesis permease subunit
MPRPREFLRAIVASLASLRLTVALLVLAIVLVALATLDQINLGVWAAQQKYIRTFVVTLVPSGSTTPIPVFPGGYLVGGALLLNLLCAQFRRLAPTWRHLGLHLAHAGLALLLVGELVSGLLTVEASLTLRPGETRAFTGFSITLLSMHSERHPGTEIVSDYSSRIRLAESGTTPPREVDIRMNRPLRHRGLAFYQGSFSPDAVTYQIVSNPGWLIPYLASLLAGIGLLYHFSITLAGFLTCRTAASVATHGSSSTVQLPRSAPARAQVWQRRAPLAAAAVALLLVACSILPPRASGSFDTAGFARLPLLDNGRIKPLDTVARTSLLLLQNRQRVRSATGEPLTPSRWLLDVCFRPDLADTYPTFRIDNDEVLALLRLAPADGDRGVRFAFHQFQPQLAELMRRARAAEAIEPARRTAFERELLRLGVRVFRYSELRHSLAAAADFAALGHAWRVGDAAAFNAAVAQLRDRAGASLSPTQRAQLHLEFLCNNAQPFYWAATLYVLALLLAFVSWLAWPDVLARCALSVGCVAWLLTTAGIAARMVIEARPPVTNLYSSALFVGWVGAGLALLLERHHRNAVGAVVAGLLGFLSLVVAHHLSFGGDTMEMMRAVLDSNFWLTVHVVTITMGYGACFVAGTLALVHILRGTLTRSLDTATAESLSRMVYGTLCFATLFSLVGTVTGGIWADQAWGRFWGWDPKENGALIIVLWNAMILHARWSGLAGPRGVMALAVFGNCITAASWFGVNMLGVGLHSYGFMDSALAWLVAFWLSQLAVVALAALPPRLWRSGAAVAA